MKSCSSMWMFCLSVQIKIKLSAYLFQRYITFGIQFFPRTYYVAANVFTAGRRPSVSLPRDFIKIYMSLVIFYVPPEIESQISHPLWNHRTSDDGYVCRLACDCINDDKNNSSVVIQTHNTLNNYLILTTSHLSPTADRTSSQMSHPLWRP